MSPSPINDLQAVFDVVTGKLSAAGIESLLISVLNGLDLERDIHPLAARYASEAVFDMVADQIKALQA